jgi:CheY-like chemotaxis protein
MGLQLAIRKNQSEPGLKRTLDMMDRQLAQLLRLVDDLLDIGRISTGKIELHLQPLILSEVLANSMEGVRTAIESRRHEVRVQIEPGKHRVRGDSARLTQVIANLIENAAKYTEPGGRIRVSLSQEDGREVLRVEDTGIGIPADELPHVFDLFSQVRVHQGKSAGGLGIGLAIVRTLVELHGGTVDAASGGLGCGSTFTLCLPALEEPASVPAPEDLSRGGSNGTPLCRRVLIVDDNVDAAASLAEFLGLEGHQTWIAHDGLKAIEIAKVTELDIVLMDLGMPGIDGIETATRIRALPGRERLCIAALTGWGQDSDRARTREAGFRWHLVKPINTTYLSELLVHLEPIQADQSQTLSHRGGIS